jgi:hypothetical protein
VYAPTIEDHILLKSSMLSISQPSNVAGTNPLAVFGNWMILFVGQSLVQPSLLFAS